METPHPLATWIDAKMKRAEFARIVGVSPSHLTLVLQDRRGLAMDVAFRIEKATEGEITAAYLNERPVSRTSASEDAA